MSQARVFSRPALLVAALFCLLAPSSALAGAPAQVSVRVEGLSETKLPPTVVTTTATPVVKDGNAADSCPGTSALGALDLATAGDWSGPWEAKLNQYSIFTIEGETHEFEEGAVANYFWSFWLDDKEAEVGACEAELQPGDRVLLFPACYGTACPTPEPTPLEIEAPATANLGEAIAVSVKRYDAKGEAAPAVAASVIGGGAGATTDAQGHATLKLFAAGSYTLSVNGAASGLPAVRTETSICVHNGEDGTCGTSAPGVPVPKGAPEAGPPPHQASPGGSVKPGGVKDGRRYRRGRGPRILSGTVHVPAGGHLREVRISLQRRHGRRCQVLSGSRAAFVRARCGVARFFSVGSAASFSYLLPRALPVGRYVYEIQATEAGGSMTATITRASRVVFYVR